MLVCFCVYLLLVPFLFVCALPIPTFNCYYAACTSHLVRCDVCIYLCEFDIHLLLFSFFCLFLPFIYLLYDNICSLIYQKGIAPQISFFSCLTLFCSKVPTIIKYIDTTHIFNSINRNHTIVVVFFIHFLFCVFFLVSCRCTFSRETQHIQTIYLKSLFS